MTQGRILVTGGAGFVGRHLLERLCRRGLPVRAIQHRDRIERVEEADLEIVDGDLTDPECAAIAVEGATDVYNCAGAVSDWAPGDRFHAVNVRIVENLIQAARTAGVRRLVHVSSTDVYGYCGRREDETAPLKPTGCGYGDSKVACELLLQAAACEELSIKIVRPSSIYGAHSQSLVLDLLDFTDWPFIPLFGRDVPAGLVEVRDVVSCLEAAMEERSPDYQAYNVCGAEPVTWAEYIQVLGRLAGKSRTPIVHMPTGLGYAAAASCEMLWRALPLSGRPPISRMQVLLSSRDQMFPTEKARSRLGFVPKVTFAEGVEALREWLLRSGRAGLMSRTGAI